MEEAIAAEAARVVREQMNANMPLGDLGMTSTLSSSGSR